MMTYHEIPLVEIGTLTYGLNDLVARTLALAPLVAEAGYIFLSLVNLPLGDQLDCPSLIVFQAASHGIVLAKLGNEKYILLKPINLLTKLVIVEGGADILVG